MTVLQKLLVPAWSGAISAAGADEVGGVVARAVDVAEMSPAQLVAAHGWAGGPFAADPEHVDVLRFESSPLMRLDDPRGSQARPWPTYPHGFLLQGVAPVWMLAHTRAPSGTEFWRIARDGSQRHLTSYGGPALGWRGAQGYHPPLELIGTRAVWRGREFPADLAPERAGVELVHVGDEEVEGFESTRPMVQRRVVPTLECEAVFELEVTARWRGAPVRVIRSDGSRARVLLVEPTAESAASLGAAELEPGLWEAVAPVQELTDRSGVRRDLDPAGLVE